MLVKPYSNLVIDLANTPLIEFYAAEPEKGTGRKLSALKYGSGTTGSNFYDEGIAEVKKSIDAYNKSGRGNYYWLFSNVCINMDIIGSVKLRDNNSIVVSYPGGEWSSNEVKSSPEIFKDYLKACDARQEKLAAQFAQASTRTPVIEQAAEIIQEIPRARLPSTDMSKIVKRYAD